VNVTAAALALGVLPVMKIGIAFGGEIIHDKRAGQIQGNQDVNA
jgi:hypothetical protein